MRATSTSIAEARSDACETLLAQLHLGRAQPAQLLAEPARARAAGVDVGAQRRLEAGGGRRGGGQRLVEPLGAGEHAGELVRARAAAAGADGGVDACGLGGAGAFSGGRRLRRGRVRGRDEVVRCLDEALRRRRPRS